MKFLIIAIIIIIIIWISTFIYLKSEKINNEIEKYTKQNNENTFEIHNNTEKLIFEILNKINTIKNILLTTFIIGLFFLTIWFIKKLTLFLITKEIIKTIV